MIEPLKDEAEKMAARAKSGTASGYELKGWCLKAETAGNVAEYIIEKNS